MQDDFGNLQENERWALVAQKMQETEERMTSFEDRLNRHIDVFEKKLDTHIETTLNANRAAVRAVEEVRQRVDENTKLTETVKQNTDGVVQAFQNAQGAFATLEWMGKVAKPFAWLFGTGGVFAFMWFEIRRRLNL